MVAHNLCVCDACRQIGKLHVKFVVHLGDVVSQRIRETEKLVGVDVIAVHRMLKNSVRAAEYVLMFEPLYKSLEPHFATVQSASSRSWKGWGGCRSASWSCPTCRSSCRGCRSRACRHGSATVSLGLRAFPRVIGLGS
jgi:hypothetical protein